MSTMFCSDLSVLAHWGQDKMVEILQTTFPNWFFLNKNCCIAIQILLKFVPNGSINDEPAFVQKMAWYQIGDKPLSEPQIDYFTDAYTCHVASMIWHMNTHETSSLKTKSLPLQKQYSRFVL